MKNPEKAMKRSLNMRLNLGLEKKLHRDMSSALSKSLNDIRKFASKSYLKKEMKNKTLYKMNREMFSLETIPRKFLKKCKFCCFLYPSFCSALDKTCFSCGVKGHFPKSKKCTGYKQESHRIPQYDGEEDESVWNKEDDKVANGVFAAKIVGFMK